MRLGFKLNVARQRGIAYGPCRQTQSSLVHAASPPVHVQAWASHWLDG